MGKFNTGTGIKDGKLVDAYIPHPKQVLFHKTFANEVLFGGPLTLDTDVLTPFGFVKIGDIGIGDEVLTPNGGVASVVDIPFEGVEDTYRVTLSDDTEIMASGGHEWFVSQASWRKKTNIHWRKKRTVDLIKDMHFNRAGRNRYSVFLAGSVDFQRPSRKWIVSPYILGCLLGDGCITRKNPIKITNEDSGILERIAAELSDGYQLNQISRIDYCITKINKRCSKKNIYADELDRLGLIGKNSYTKFIPDEYLRSTIDDRIALLQGIMDTDGCVKPNGELKLVTTSERLKDDFKFLVRSLGGITNNNHNRTPDNAFRIYAKMPPEIMPFSLGRKVKRVEGSKQRAIIRTITNIEYVGKERVKCITIDNPDHLIIVNNFTVTCNSAGPGKSRALRAEALRWACTIPGLQIYLFRRTFPELEKNHIIPSQMEFPKDLGEYKSQARRWEFFNGSMLHFCHCQYEQDVFQYQGAEIHILLIDELTTFTKFQYDYLRGRVRCTLPVPDKFKHKVPGIYCASNPGGVGHTFCRARWVDYAKAMEVKRAPVLEGGMLRQYIPALLEDNPTLTSTDPGYRSRLEALPEPYRTAYLKGDWDIFIGQAFDFYYDYHVVKDHPVPSGAPVYMTFDWGFGAPFSVGWWYVDQDGRLIRFSEWYGWDGNQNKGLRLTDIEVADGINTREQAMGVLNVVQRIAGPDCFQKKPDYRGGGQGPSTAEIFSNRNLFLTAGDANRKLKIRQFRNRLMVPKDDKGNVVGRPMLQVFESCTQFIRTIPAISAMPSNPEDIDTTGEDHIYDECCHICMARPMNFDDTKLVLKPLSTILIDSLSKKQPDEEFGDYVASEVDAYEKAMGYGHREMDLIYDRV